MNIWLVLIVIAILSVIFSLISLKNLDSKSQLKEVRKKLFKGRVVFQDSSSESKK